MMTRHLSDRSVRFTFLALFAFLFIGKVFIVAFFLGVDLRIIGDNAEKNGPPEILAGVPAVSLGGCGS